MKTLRIFTVFSMLLGTTTWAAEPASNHAYCSSDNLLGNRINTARVNDWLDGAAATNAVMNSLSPKSEYLKESSICAPFVCGEIRSKSNSLARDNDIIDRSIAEGAFVGVKISSAADQGSILTTAGSENLRLSKNFGSYKGQISTVSVPTRYIPTGKVTAARVRENKGNLRPTP